MKWREAGLLLKETLTCFGEDNAQLSATAAAYYAFFALAPLLLIGIRVAGLIFGQEAARGQVLAQLESWVGAQNAETIQKMIEDAGRSRTGAIATLVGVVTLLYAGYMLFYQLQVALNAIWKTQPTTTFLSRVLSHLTAFLLIAVVALLVMVLVALNATLAAVAAYFKEMIPGVPFLQIANLCISLLVMTLALAAIYKLLPNCDIGWGDVWLGAFVTAVLLVIAQYLIALYFTHLAGKSSYGAAGTLVAVLVWIQYSTTVFFYGAEFTKAYTRRQGKCVPEEPPSTEVGTN